MSVIREPRNAQYQLTTWESISTSNAKQKFSFGKAQRFKYKTSETKVGYDLPSTISKRGAGIGFGMKLDLGKIASSKQLFNLTVIDSPPPTTYTLRSVFDPVEPPSVNSRNSLFKERKKTFCFGAGREHFEKVYNPASMTPDECVPGPGSYSDRTKNIAVNARKWSLQGRNMYMDSTSLALKRAIPSPSEYGDVNKMDSLGFYINSENM